MKRALVVVLVMWGCKDDQPARSTSGASPAASRRDAGTDANALEGELRRQGAALPDHTPLSTICEKDPSAEGCAELEQRRIEAARKKLEELRKEAAKLPRRRGKVTPEECQENPLAKGCDEIRDAAK